MALYNKPTFVFSFINNVGSGSGRAIDQIDIGSIVLELKANDLIEDGGGPVSYTHLTLPTNREV